MHPISNSLTGFDVCLCTGGDCPLRFLCHRFLAEPVSRQDFSELYHITVMANARNIGMPEKLSDLY